MIRKTALLLDDELIAMARSLLGTTTTTDTVHTALRDVVDRELRRRWLQRMRTMDGTDLADDAVMSQACR